MVSVVGSKGVIVGVVVGVVVIVVVVVTIVISGNSSRSNSCS